MAKSTNPFMAMLAAKKAGTSTKPSKGAPKGKTSKMIKPKGKGSK